MTRRRLTPEQVRRVLEPPPPDVFAIGKIHDFGLTRKDKDEPEKQLAKILRFRHQLRDDDGC